MSFLNKILFWRKEDTIEALAHQEMSGKSVSNKKWEQLSGEKSAFPDPFSSDAPPLESPFQRESPLLQRDLELISTKLDAIKAMISSLEQRMANVERSLTKDQKQRLW